MSEWVVVLSPHHSPLPISSLFSRSAIPRRNGHWEPVLFGGGERERGGNQPIKQNSKMAHADNDTLSAPELEDSSAETKPAAPSGDKGGDVKIDDDDVKLIVAQTGCTEEKAREALKEEKGDLINASTCCYSSFAPFPLILVSMVLIKPSRSSVV